MHSGHERYDDEMTKRARVEISSVVRVAIMGFRAPEEARRHSRLPLIPRDNGLVQEFMRWMLNESDIHPAFPSSSGGGQYVAYFNAADMPRVEAWLEAHNEIAAAPELDGLAK